MVWLVVPDISSDIVIKYSHVGRGLETDTGEMGFGGRFQNPKEQKTRVASKLEPAT